MEIINAHGVDEDIFRFMSWDNYDTEDARGTISATTMLKPIQAVILKERFDDQIKVDCMDRFNVLFGSAVHAVIESANQTTDGNTLVEKRFFWEILKENISGKADKIDKRNGIITDYKTGKVHSLKYVSEKINGDWKLQLSVLRYLAEKNGIKDITTGKIIFIARDWREDEASNEAFAQYYPPAPLKTFAIPLLEIKETSAFIRSFVGDIQRARSKPDWDLPKCTARDKWKNDIRCMKYCDVKQFCYQFSQEQIKRRMTNDW